MPRDWERIAFAGVRAAIVTVVIVYIVSKVFGIAQGTSTGDIVERNTYTAAQQVSTCTELALSVIVTFLVSL